MRSENMRPGGCEGSVAGVVYLAEDDVAGSTYGIAVTGYIKLLEPSQPMWRHGRVVVFLDEREHGRERTCSYR